MPSARSDLTGALEAALGAHVRGLRPLSGGDINQAFEVALADGRVVFAKTNDNAPATMFPAEARGLAWLAEAGALRVPRVLASGPKFLALELIAEGAKPHGFDEALGHGLAALHRTGAPGFGLVHDNFIGRLPQTNASAPTWPDFYRTRRLQPQLDAARGLIDTGLRHAFDALFARLPDLCGPPEPPARVHGDLWAGNLLCDDAGAPCLIDPAVYGGHREMDLAMMRLFGGFGPRVFAAYEDAFPLSDDAADRVDLCQLYPLLVHVNLFGGSYVGAVRAALDRLL